MIFPQYARLDGPEPERGLDLVTPDVRFLLALPGRVDRYLNLFQRNLRLT